jgi:hypothetical protein
LYDGVKDGLKLLAEKYPLFILSNCAKGIIRQFIDWAGIDDLIKDELAHGVNFMPKNHNIKLLMQISTDLKPGLRWRYRRRWAAKPPGGHPVCVCKLWFWPNGRLRPEV